MSAQASKTVIGGFVVGALVLVVAGVMVFGSGRILKRTMKWTLFFEDSINGLDVGAPVVFQGVQIGTVEDITLWIDPRKVFPTDAYISATTADRLEMWNEPGVRKEDEKLDRLANEMRGLAEDDTEWLLAEGRVVVPRTDLWPVYPE